MGKKVKEGNCALCGKFKILSFEHVPPQSAFNNVPVLIQTHEHLVEKTSYLFGKSMKNNKGSGDYTLCIDCNNNTGDWYARDFGDFAHQGMSVIKSRDTIQRTITGQYEIKPLNIIKQILTMFMSIDKTGHLRSQSDLIDFILKKESIGLPSRYKVFLYSTLSIKRRLIGYCIASTEEQGIQKWSEINFPPFGYFLAEDSFAANKHMLDISTFSTFSYNQKVLIRMSTPYLIVNSPWIGLYK